jgi:hypothetical protein
VVAVRLLDDYATAHDAIIVLSQRFGLFLDTGFDGR